jgi:NAD(P)-dependent dehydrogenase (short-subunit alcohol dehydrogenase family)
LSSLSLLKSDSISKMTGKVLMISGGSRGIGAATAIIGASHGYDVSIIYREHDAAAQDVLRQIHGHGRRGLSIKGNVALEADILKWFDETDLQLGRVTALVNNAGILHKQSRVVEMDAKRLQDIFAVNAIAPFICSREAVRRMSIKSGGAGGSIVNVSSTAIRQGGPFEYVDYAASKGALDVFTLGLSKEVAAEGIRVNAVRPGIVDTEIHASGGEPGRVERVKHTIPMQRGANPEEIAKAILWLLSDDASYCAGTILDVSGGR